MVHMHRGSLPLWWLGSEWGLRD